MGFSLKIISWLFMVALLSSGCTNKDKTAPSPSITHQQSQWPVPFVLPYDDDSPGITHFGARLNHKPAGSKGPLTLSKDGHFAVGGERIKFWGVNIVDASCFPSHEHAEKIAARLSKFGVNIVRFHHLESTWGKQSLLDYSAGNSRTIDKVSLEKLDYFIAQLKAQGIYSNLNLLTSRAFQPGDGLPESIEPLEWKRRQALTFISPQFRQLEKEYARRLLEHTNPYTNQRYADDPAVAIVEINNENSIFQEYFFGFVDSWPAEFKQPLQEKWNQWLAARYQTDVNLHKGWGTIFEPFGDKLLVNPDFKAGMDQWQLQYLEGAYAQATTGVFDDRPGIKITVQKPGQAHWNVQIYQPNLAFKKGHVYTLKFAVKADHHKAISVAIMQHHAPWIMYEHSHYKISEQWQQHSFTFVATFDDDNTRLNIGNLGIVLGDVYIADISLVEGGVLGRLPLGQSLANRNIELNSPSNQYTSERIFDWMTFLYEIDQAYWTDMHQFLVNDIGIKGLPYGTITALSPPGIQAQFGFIDSHSYWSHPYFPRKQFDREDWTVQNISMVNTLRENTLDALSRQRVAGLPFTVSEYLHSLPNNFAAEAPLLIGAYGALQDWDGIYFFTFDAGDEGWDANHFSTFMQPNMHPSSMVNIAAAANLFLRSDVNPALEEQWVPYDRQTELTSIAVSGHAWRVAPGEYPESMVVAPFVHRIGRSLEGNTLTPEPQSTQDLEWVQSDTGELTWNLRHPNKGIVSINTKRSKGVLGYVEGQRLNLGKVTIDIGQLQFDWATLLLTATQGELDNFDQGAAILAVATGRTENTDMQWKDTSHTTLGSNWGKAPTLIEVVPFSVEFPVTSSRIQAWALDPRGQRQQKLPVETTENGARVLIDGSNATLWYEIDISANTATFSSLTHN